MDNLASFSAVASAGVSPNFIKPLYGSYCFAGIPGAIQHLLLGSSNLAKLPPDVLGTMPSKYRNVVLCLIDAFGWRFLEEYRELAALKTLRNEGVASKLTSQFPSTTAVHVTTMMSGHPVNQSGVLEWFYYDHHADDTVSPFIYCHPRDEPEAAKRQLKVKPSDIFPSSKLFTSLNEQGVKVWLSQPSEFFNSKYNAHFGVGTTSLPYRSVQEGLRSFSEQILSSQGSNYFYYYYPKIDKVCHYEGPGSKPLEHEVRTFWDLFERYLLTPLRGKLSDTLLIITADHGQVSMNPKTTIFIDKEIPEIPHYTKRNEVGTPIYPAGAARDLFLHLLPEHKAALQSELSEKLTGRAEVHDCQKLIADGFFGIEPPSERFLKNIADLVILPYAGESVSWSEYHRPFLGHHGGLTREEMEIPFIAMSLG